MVLVSVVEAELDFAVLVDGKGYLLRGRSFTRANAE